MQLEKDFWHPTYRKHVTDWRFAGDLYTGDAFRKGKIENYLIRRAQGEHIKNYEERKKEALADPALDYAVVVDTLVGLAMTAEPKSTRTWFESNDAGNPIQRNNFGDPAERGTIAYRLKDNIDGKGTNLSTLLRHVAQKLTTKHYLWGLVDNAITRDGQTVKPVTLHVVDPEDVPSWREEAGRLVEVIVEDMIDTRSGIFDRNGEAEKEVLVRYTRNGWAYVTEKGEVDTELMQTQTDFDTEAGVVPYEYYDGTDKNAPRMLPIYQTEIRLERMVGYLMARKAAAIFNTESEIDSYGRLTNLPRFGIVDSSSEDDNLEKIAAGKSWIRIPVEGNVSQFITPPAEHLTSRMERLRQKRVDFYAQSFREYGQAAGQQTATEKQMDWATSVLSYLIHLTDPLEEFENEGMRRIEQAEFPDNPEAWGQVHNSRSTDYKPEDIREQLQQLAGEVFGRRGMPITPEIEAQIASRYLDEYGFEVDEEALLDVAQRRQRQDEQRGAAAAEFGVDL